MSKATRIVELRPPLERGFDAAYADWKEWESGQFGQYSAVDAQYFAAEFGIRVPSEARVLEIGFGNGSALAWLHAVGADTYGLEANPLLVERAGRLLGLGRAFNDINDPMLTALAGTFTHVIALDVVEHVPLNDLPGMLSRIRELLAPGGAAVLRFPNGDSPFGRITQHGDPTHVTTLGGARMAFLAERAGLHPELIRAPALPIRGAGLARGCRRLMIHVARALIEYGVSQIYFGGRRIPLDRNYTAVLRRQS